MGPSEGRNLVRLEGRNLDNDTVIIWDGQPVSSTLHKQQLVVEAPQGTPGSEVDVYAYP
jgi:hypothetical protein